MRWFDFYFWFVLCIRFSLSSLLSLSLSFCPSALSLSFYIYIYMCVFAKCILFRFVSLFWIIIPSRAKRSTLSSCGNTWTIDRTIFPSETNKFISKKVEEQKIQTHTHTHSLTKKTKCKRQAKNSTIRWNSTSSSITETRKKMQFKSEKNGLRRMLYRY